MKEKWTMSALVQTSMGILVGAALALGGCATDASERLWIPRFGQNLDQFYQDLWTCKTGEESTLCMHKTGYTRVPRSEVPPGRPPTRRRETHSNRQRTTRNAPVPGSR